MDHALPGSFSKPGVHEIVGDVACPPAGSGNNASVLARETDGHFVIVDSAEAADSRVSRGDRRLVATKRRTALVLFRDSSASAGVLSQSVNVVDYSAPKEPSYLVLLSLEDSTGKPCDGGPRVSARIVNVDVRDVDGDGNDDVRIQAQAGKVDCRGKPAPKPRTLEFDSKDGKLEPTAATKKTLLQFQSLADD